MRAADPIAARAFYGEAIALAEGHCDGHCVPASEVAKLHANRCAALLAMERPGEALADARRAAALAPTWSKACYRLGGVLHKLGRLSAAKTALRRAAALAAEGGEGGEGGGGDGGGGGGGSNDGGAACSSCRTLPGRRRRAHCQRHCSRRPCIPPVPFARHVRIRYRSKHLPCPRSLP